jgi:acetoin utilization protein AcuB
MTLRPMSIPASMTIAEARQIMREHTLRHLPVVENGKLVGMLSDRDVHILEACAHIDPTEACVREAMSIPLTVDKNELIDVVADRMAASRCNSAVIVDHGEIRGIFTATDALVALAELVRRATA